MGFEGMRAGMMGAGTACTGARGGVRGAAGCTCAVSARMNPPQAPRSRRAHRTSHMMGMGGEGPSRPVAMRVNSGFSELMQEGGGEVIEVGTKVRVKTDVVVYHVAGTKGQGFNLKGMEGAVVDRADQYKGIETTANLPYKVEIVQPEGEKPPRILAHLTEQEIEVV